MDTGSLCSPLTGNHGAQKGKRRRSWFVGTPHKQNLEVQDDIPVLKLTYFTKKVILCFDDVLIGKIKTCYLRIENPCDFIQNVYLEKFPFEKGFDIAKTEWTLQSEEHLLVPITWCPVEEGNVRQLVTFKFEGMHRLQIIIVGTAKIQSSQKKLKRPSLVSTQLSNTVQIKKSQKHEVMDKRKKLKKVKLRQQIDVENIDPVSSSTNRRTNKKRSKTNDGIPLKNCQQISISTKTASPHVFEHCSILPTDNNLPIQSNIKRETITLSELPCSPAVALGLYDDKSTTTTNISDVEQFNITVNQEADESDDSKSIRPKTSQLLDVTFPVQKKSTTSTLRKKRSREGSTENVSPKKLKNSIPIQIKALKMPSKSHKRPIKKGKKGVAISHLMLKKADIPRHPMPFAAKNMFYDERWIDKQEQGFVKWLNYILTPEDYSLDPKCKSAKVNASKLFLSASTMGNTRAPTKEVLSLRAYSARRQMNRLRREACSLFQSEPVIRVIQKIEAEVERGGLEIRKDKHIHADYGIKENLLNMMLSYNPLWLRIGLETIYGEMLAIENNDDVVGLSRFIVTRMLYNPDIAAEFAHPTVPAFFRPGYEDALNKFILKKFLVLVLFLDRAKLTRLIDHDPCLFYKDSEYKSNRKLLLSFSKEYLKGEGDVTRHLSFLGYCVTHKQTPLDEFDFSVTNLATDLRCGIRLVRIVELLIRDWKLSGDVRVPAISRLQKIHNMKVVFNAMKNCREVEDLDPKVIVDGNREKTLHFLWTIIFQLQIKVFLNKNQLRDEIGVLKRIQLMNTTLASLQSKESLTHHVGCDSSSDIYLKNEELSLLLQWCKAVCSLYNLQIDNFTVSFSDGRALCYLVHHYHPGLLPFEAIKQDTTQWFQNFGQETDTAPGQSSDVKLENERANYKLLFDKVKELGGVPLMVKSKDMINTIPDEKVVITYVSHLCVRLLALHRETSCARVIQSAWKLYKVRQCLRVRQVKESSAVIIQQTVRKYLRIKQFRKRINAAKKIQIWYRCILARKHLDSLKLDELMKEKQIAAEILQRWFRSYILRKGSLQLRKSAIILQAYTRGYQTRKFYRNLKKAVTVVQTRYRSLHYGRQVRQRYLTQKAAVLKLQTAFRDHLVCLLTKKVKAVKLIQATWRSYKTKEKASLKIQSVFRGYLAKKTYIQIKHAVVTIQNYFRRFLLSQNTRKQFLRLRHSCLIIQNTFREVKKRKRTKQYNSACIIQATYKMYGTRKEYLQMKQATTKIQAAFRCYYECRHFQSIRKTTINLQRRYRANKQMLAHKTAYGITRGACITVQAAFKAYLCRRNYLNLKKKVIRIQTCYRAFKARSSYLKLRKATQILQKRLRALNDGRRQCRVYMKVKSATMLIQSVFRGYRCRKVFQETKKAIILIQSCCRCYQAKKIFAHKKKAATLIQSFYRRYRIMKMYQSKKKAAILIQSIYRCYEKRRMFQEKKEAIIFIQSLYRGYQMRNLFLKKKKSTILLQCIFRKKSFQKKKTATILIQSVYRGYRMRKMFQEKKNAALTIQYAYNTYMEKKSFQKRTKAAILLQSAYRGYQSRGKFSRQKNAAILIQSAYRGYQSRGTFSRQKNAAILIQSAYRGYQSRGTFSRQKKAAILIQSAYRGYQSRGTFSRQKNAAILIQSAYRGYQSRGTFSRQKNAAILIQSAYRGYQSRGTFSRQKNAAILIQSAYRGYQSRGSFSRQKNAAILIQSAYRGYQSRGSFSRQKNAAILIQSAYRGYQSRGTFNRQKNAAIIIQSAYRGYRSRGTFSRQKNAAILIQSAYRGYRSRGTFSRQKNAAIIIQSAYRGYQSRGTFSRQKNAAILIQSAYRGYQSRGSFSRQKNAAILIQSAYRGYQSRGTFSRQKKAAILIQSAYRGYQSRGTFSRQKNAAILIQSAYRGYQSRGTFSRQKNAAILIQSAYRGYQSRGTFSRQKNAAILIQSAYRGYQSRGTFSRQKNAAILIQSAYRGYQSRGTFSRQKNAAILIQSAYRGYRSRGTFSRQKNAAILIQSAYRGYQSRGTFSRQKNAAILIQSAYRGYQSRGTFSRQKNAAILIQSAYRGYQSRGTFSRQKKAAILIQSAYRGYQSRGTFSMQKKAAILIQSAYRGYQSRGTFSRQKNAAILIQSAYRGYCGRKGLFEKKTAVLLIQSVYRGSQTRKCFLKNKKAAVTIQSYVRKWIFQKRYSSLKGAALLIQSLYRAKLLRNVCFKSFQKKKNATILLQAYVRRYLVSKHYRMKLTSLIRIQASVRTFLQRKRYLAHRNAVLSIQKRYRATVIAKYARYAYLYKRGACIVIQSHIRGFLVRSYMRKLNAAARHIQAVYRCHRQITKYKCMRKSAIVIQTFWRANLSGRKQFKKYLHVKKSIIIIQKMTRRYLQIANQKKAATIIQSHFRMYKQRKIFKRLRISVLFLQACIRRCHCRRNFLRMQSAVTILQIHFRSWKVMKNAQYDFECTRAATIKMQAFFRGKMKRKEYLKNKSSVVAMQAKIRSKRIRKYFLQLKQSTIFLQQKFRALMKVRQDYINYHCKRGAIIVIQAGCRSWMIQKWYRSVLKANITLQAACRGYIQRKAFKVQKNAIIALQLHFRNYSKGNLQRKLYICKRLSVLTIQKAYRQYRSRKEERKGKAATTIQAFYKSYRQQQAFLELRTATIVIQRKYRSLKEVETKCKSAICIQAWFRSCIAKRVWKRYLSDVIQIQAAVRGWKARSEFKVNLKQHRAALCLQKAFKMYITGKHIMEEEQRRGSSVKRFSAALYVNFAAIRIQRKYRCFKLLQIARKRIQSVIVIQRWMKCKLQYIQYSKLRCGVIALQKAVRLHQQKRQKATVTLQSYFRMFQIQKKVCNMKNAALNIQRVWRGYIVRKKLKIKKLKLIRGRFIVATKEATEDKKLCNRTETALDYIMRYKQVSHILEALRNLDVVTRLSPVCCEKIVEGQALPIIFILIKNCNRSLPCMEVVKYCINILTHLAKYPKTCAAVYDIPDCVMFLIELIQMYREKPKLFVSICKLLIVFCQNEHYAKKIRCLPKFAEKMQSIHVLTKRKHKLAVQRVIVKKQTQFLPDWDLSAKPCMSDNPLLVVEMLMNLLHLKPK
ncbi:uncharacterized protein [Antedon mediterranea]|uniref:uncharacterized protein n=1 Tax=Antedon mediterranea TaxID=105859 RepID=UPI003AF48D48